MTNGSHDLNLVYGDEFLVKEEVRKLVSEVLDPELQATNLIVLDGNNLDLSELSAQLFTPSLFGGFRVVVVDQTPMFMGKVDQRKLLDKVVRSWKSNDRKTAFRAFGQLMSLAGVDSRDIAEGTGWINELSSGSPGTGETETLVRVARSFLESGEKAESKADEALMEELISSPLPSETMLILTAPAVDKRKKIFKAVKKRARVIACAAREERFGPGLEKSFFDDRVKTTLADAGKRISSDALQKMYSRSGKELRRLHSELEKLIAYVGDRKEVRVKDVENAFNDFHEAAFYELNRALRTGDIKKCLPALHENLKIVEHPLQTLAAIANEFRRLMVAREMLFTVFKSYWERGMTYDQFKRIAPRVKDEHPELMGKGKYNLLSMHEYPLYLFLRDAQKFPMERLTRIMEAILEADVMMKSTKIGSSSPASIMEDLIFTICRPRKSRGRPDQSRQR